MKVISGAILVEYSDQDRWRDDFHHQMMPMDAGAAVLAFPLQDDVTDDGDIEVKGDLVSTRSTGR